MPPNEKLDNKTTTLFTYVFLWRCLVAFRFNYRVKLFPGARLNVSKGGVSTILGKRGASVSLGKKGYYANAGLPGTGVSYRTRLDSKNTRLQNDTTLSQAIPDQTAQSTLRLELEDNGKLNMYHKDGAALTSKQVKMVWEREGSTVHDWLAQQIIVIEGETKALLSFHHETPKPQGQSPTYDWQDFKVERPEFHHELNVPTEPAPPLVVSSDDFLSRFARIQAWRIRRYKEKTKEFHKKHHEWLHIKEKAEVKFELDRVHYTTELKTWKAAKKSMMLSRPLLRSNLMSN